MCYQRNEGPKKQKLMELPKKRNLVKEFLSLAGLSEEEIVEINEAVKDLYMQGNCTRYRNKL